MLRVGRRPRVVSFETTSETRAVTCFDPEYRTPAASLSKTAQAADHHLRVRESEMMDERLRASGKDSRVVIYDGLDHSLPSGEIRADMLRRSDAFLRTALHIPAA